MDTDPYSGLGLVFSAAGSSALPSQRHEAETPVPSKAMSSDVAFAAGRQMVSEFQVGDEVQYFREGTHNWVKTIVEARRTQNGVVTYDLTCKRAAPCDRVREAVVEYKIGEAVEYWSSSSERWIAAEMLSLKPDSKTCDLDVKLAAPLSKVRKASASENAEVSRASSSRCEPRMEEQRSSNQRESAGGTGHAAGTTKVVDGDSRGKGGYKGSGKGKGEDKGGGKGKGKGNDKGGGRSKGSGDKGGYQGGGKGKGKDKGGGKSKGNGDPDKNYRCKIYVSSLAPGTTAKSLRDIFDWYGEIVNSFILLNPDTRQSKCCGFVEFRDAACVSRALTYKMVWVEGKYIRVQRARRPRLGHQAAAQSKETPDEPDFEHLGRMLRLKRCQMSPNEADKDLADKVFNVVADVCRSTGAEVHLVGSTQRQTNISNSDVDMVCLFDRPCNMSGVVQAALRALKYSVSRRDDYFKDSDSEDEREANAESRYQHHQRPSGPLRHMKKALVPIEKLLYSHDTISHKFKDGKLLSDLVDQLRSGTVDHLSHADLELQVVLVNAPQTLRGKNRDKMFCLNNRRLWCFKKLASAGQLTDVRVCLYNYETDPPFFGSRLTTVNGGVSVDFREQSADDFVPDPLDSSDMVQNVQLCSTKGEVIHLQCDGIGVDVLVSATKTLKPPRLEEAALETKFGLRHVWAAVFLYQHNFCDELKLKSEVRDAVRIAKEWCERVAFPKWNPKCRPRGFLIELLVVYVASSLVMSSPWDIFCSWLNLCARQTLPQIKWKWTNLGDHPRVNWGNGPLVLDPCNPTNNVARQFRHWSDLRSYAAESLKKIRSAVLQASTKDAKTPRAHKADADHRESHFPQFAAHREVRGSDGVRDLPKTVCASPLEVRVVLEQLSLPLDGIQCLIQDGFDSLDWLYEHITEQDMEEAGMNKVQRRQLSKALERGGHIYEILQAEDRLPVVNCRGSTSSGVMTDLRVPRVLKTPTAAMTRQLQEKRNLEKRCGKEFKNLVEAIVCAEGCGLLASEQAVELRQLNRAANSAKHDSHAFG
ncbi:unnamed protein product [Polarella glacialis]|uniref:RRM domain-containing protein n=1 Tax=Polarella glacialis TaxID=89957 RepID=A0A813L018_POLGL|nr:unnamed protein product [Polarella glacialis]CAE8719777.1 unnamed protein product [Polarella glacialis]